MENNNRGKKRFFASKRQPQDYIPDENTELFEKLVMERRLSTEQLDSMTQGRRYADLVQKARQLKEVKPDTPGQGVWTVDPDVTDDAGAYEDALAVSPDAEYTEPVTEPVFEYLPDASSDFNPVEAYEPDNNEDYYEDTHYVAKHLKPQPIENTGVLDNLQPQQSEEGLNDQYYDYYSGNNVNPVISEEGGIVEENTRQITYYNEEQVDLTAADHDEHNTVDIIQESPTEADYTSQNNIEYQNSGNAETAETAYYSNETPEDGYYSNETAENGYYSNETAETAYYSNETAENGYYSNETAEDGYCSNETAEEGCYSSAATEAEYYNAYPDGPEQYDTENETETSKRGPSSLCIIAAACLAASLLTFSLFLKQLDVLPGLFYGAAILLCALFNGFVVFLLWNSSKKGRFIPGIALFVFSTVFLILGTVFMGKTWNTAKKITTVDTVMTNVNVYVRTDDTSSTIKDTAGYIYGVLKNGDREDTNQALKLIANELGASIQVAEYEDVVQLVQALFLGNIQSVVMESYHLELLSSAEEPTYVALAAQARELCTYSVEKKSTDYETAADIGLSPIQQQQEEPVAEEEEDNSLIAVYISGIDTFGSVNVQSRSDVNILAFINTSTHQVLLVTTPRDYYVYTPVSGSYRDKLTHAGLWGPECSMGALEYLYDCEIDYYFRLNFSGFIKIIDSLGGIDFSYSDGGSVSHLSGEAALEIARDRTYCGSDFNRGINQTRIIKAVIRKALSSDLLYNFDSVLEAIEGSFETTIPYDVMTGLVKQQLSSNPDWDVIAVAADGTGTSNIPYAFVYYGNSTGMYAYVCEPNRTTVDNISQMIKKIENNEIVDAEDTKHE